jgi:selenocysteine lyase/cysteine desulfurase
VTPGEARPLWAPEGVYLNTATFGLPPEPAWAALQQALADWRHGRTSWEAWAEETDRARRLFARLVGVPAEQVAVGATVSELVGLVAAAARAGRVVSAEGDFTSLLWPWAALGFEVETVPLDRLAGAVDAATAVVAVSAVQSATGELADLEAIAAAAGAHDALVVVDATQACGWLPLDASRFDAVACAGYKWLCTPRGTAYLTLSERLLETVTPAHAGWFAGEDYLASFYGLPLRLASSARRLDTSPAWFSWVAAPPALELLLELGVEQIERHDVALANRFRAGLGLEPGVSAIVKVEVAGAAERLARAGIRSATRAGSVRASFHVYTTETDVDAALDALTAG